VSCKSHPAEEAFKQATQGGRQRTSVAPKIDLISSCSSPNSKASGREFEAFAVGSGLPSAPRSALSRIRGSNFATQSTIVIARRPHTIVHADAILVIEGREIVERGSMTICRAAAGATLRFSACSNAKQVLSLWRRSVQPRKYEPEFPHPTRRNPS
jgi:hypothetical protein